MSEAPHTPASFRNLIPQSIVSVGAVDSGIKFRNDASVFGEACSASDLLFTRIPATSAGITEMRGNHP
ncbi:MULTISPECIES: hypothetical protein [unclassified Roseitalea]|uniref:hypothetical protein n=1 Tax=unclassified Roseitalea TaxID=2639107 RepID=UPI00273EEC62|nr:MULTISPECIES: hypothetical protein [unclassified Roseitalea]